MHEDITRRPGRPKSAEKADAIRHAAAELFMADGMERTSMDAIAEAAGVSKQTVYSHFNSKDDLFRACVRSKIEMYGLEASTLEVSDDIDVCLRHIGKQYLTLLGDGGVIQMFRLMISEAEKHPGTVKAFHEAGPVTTSHNIAGIIAKHLPGAPDNVELAAEATREFLALVRGEYFLEYILGTRTEIPAPESEAHLDHCVRQIGKLYSFQ